MAKIYDIIGRAGRDAEADPAVLDIIFTACITDYARRQNLLATEPRAVLLLGESLLPDPAALTDTERDYCGRTADADADRAPGDRATARRYALATAAVHVVMRKYYHKLLTDPEAALTVIRERRERAQECARRLYGEEMDFTTVPVRGNPTVSHIHERLGREAGLPQRTLEELLH